jgi:hypothetical protein
MSAHADSAGDEAPSDSKKTKVLHPELVRLNEELAAVLAQLKSGTAVKAEGDSIVPSDKDFNVNLWMVAMMATLNELEVTEETCPIIESIFDHCLMIVWQDAAFFAPVRDEFRKRVDEIMEIVVAEHESFEDLVSNGGGLLDDME